jgi:hypothetical protein
MCVQVRDRVRAVIEGLLLRDIVNVDDWAKKGLLCMWEKRMLYLVMCGSAVSCCLKLTRTFYCAGVQEQLTQVARQVGKVARRNLEVYAPMYGHLV